MLAMMAKLSPTAEKKPAKRFTSSVLKFLARAQESVLAKVTNSQPEGPLQEFIKSPILVYTRGTNCVIKFFDKKVNFCLTNQMFCDKMFSQTKFFYKKE